MKIKSMRSGLMATTTFCSMLTGLLVPALMASSAQAQDAAAEAPKEVVVTGSIIRKKNLTSMSPLTVITATDLEKRGVTTIESATQNLPGNNGGAMTNNWSASGNFAAGASGISLRGLTTNSTLVLVDGMRMAYYPLADDATRNFVDMNTIPDAVVDRVEILQDGASSTYGADAIAGVINIITKKQVQGFTAKATVGARNSGDGAGTTSFSALWGKGDLAKDGYNFYASAEYQKDDILMARDTDFPVNTANQSSICAKSLNAPNSVGVNGAGVTCATNGIVNGIQFDDIFAGAGTTTVATVRPYDATNTTPVTGGKWQLLNPTLGCGALTPVTITANQARRLTGQTAVSVTGATLCQQDLVKTYNTIIPENTRKSFSARLTKRFSDTMEGYVSYTYYGNEASYTGRGGPRSIQAVTTPGAAGTSASTAGIALPVYICAKTTVGACTASNGTLNPQNPFASLGQSARLLYRFADIPYYTETKSNTYRIAGGLSGSADGWNYDVDATYMLSKLNYDKYGSPILQRILDVVKDGSYNFMDPTKNTQAVRDYIAPPSFQYADSELGMIQASASKPLMDLAGGPLQLGVGAAFRYERVNNPSGNPDPAGGNPFNRYDGAINPFGAVGYRHVSSANFELDAPFTPKLDVSLGGRFDSYSSGFEAFSPKIAASYKALSVLSVRGAFSKGFRAPSIAENNSDPSTGFVTLSAPASFQAAHGNNGYGAGYSVGLTTVAAKNLKPELSENTSLGLIFTPTKNLALTLDYFKIHKQGIIAGGDFAPALDAYFAGQPIPAGFAVIPGVADPLNPTLLPTPGFVQYGLVNLAAQDIAGFDGSASARFNIGGARWTSSAEVSYIQYYTQTYPDGTKQRYDGTLGNNQITSGSGTPKWKGNWTNTLEMGPATLSATAYYVDGYKSIAADNGDDYYGTCAEGHTAALFRDGATLIACDIKSFVNVDLHGSYKFSKNYSVMVDVMNLFDEAAPYDPNSTYRLTQYNVAFHNAGVLGRYLKVTGKVTF